MELASLGLVDILIADYHAPSMLYAALDQVQFNIPEVLVEADQTRNKVTVAVNEFAPEAGPSCQPPM